VSKFALKFIAKHHSQRYLEYTGIEKSEACTPVEVNVFDAGRSSHAFYYSVFCELSRKHFKLETVEVKSPDFNFLGKVLLHFSAGKHYRRCTLDNEGSHNIDGAYNFTGRFGIQVELTGITVRPEVTLHFGGSNV
jgi:hypothetical protein